LSTLLDVVGHEFGGILLENVVDLVEKAAGRRAARIKLDELIRGVKGARTGLVHLKELTDDQLKELEASFQALRRRAAPAEITKSSE
jgi:low affinity Fe/Cu permease